MRQRMQETSRNLDTEASQKECRQPLGRLILIHKACLRLFTSLWGLYLLYQVTEDDLPLFFFSFFLFFYIISFAVHNLTSLFLFQSIKEMEIPSQWVELDDTCKTENVCLIRMCLQIFYTSNNSCYQSMFYKQQ